ncbi:MAG: fibronectin type III domain-containing protein, partial [Thermoplasmata archaeon]|nr:fibronectin type III domain-containing protein [Thermoplasmata archaeon]
GTQAMVHGLENGVAYFFVVRAEDAAGNEEDNVVEHSAMPTTPIDSTPPTFDGLSNVVTDNKTGDITLTWNAAVDPDEPECNSDPSMPIVYNIYVSETPGVFDFSIPTATTTQQQYPFLDLERGVTYYFIVRAEDGSGNEETNDVTKSAELKVEKGFDLMDWWWLILVIVIIILLVAIIVLLARRGKVEEPAEEAEVIEEVEEEVAEETAGEE